MSQLLMKLWHKSSYPPNSLTPCWSSLETPMDISKVLRQLCMLSFKLSGERCCILVLTENGSTISSKFDVLIKRQKWLHCHFSYNWKLVFIHEYLLKQYVIQGQWQKKTAWKAQELSTKCDKTSLDVSLKVMPALKDKPKSEIPSVVKDEAWLEIGEPKSSTSIFTLWRTKFCW